MKRAVVVGLGQPRAGDDAVGLFVARAISARGVPALESSDASVVVGLLARGERVVVVDAVVGGGSPGRLLRLSPEAIAGGPAPLSSHGLGLREGIELAKILFGVDPSSALAIVAVVIEPSGLGRPDLSPDVAAAIAPAAALAIELARGTSRAAPKA